jgi:hypothetical protein
MEIILITMIMLISFVVIRVAVESIDTWYYEKGGYKKFKSKNKRINYE